MNWSTQKASEVERLLSTDITKGLTSKIAALRLKEEGKNFLDRSLDVTLASVLKNIFFDVAHLPILCAIIMSFSYQSFLFGMLALSGWGGFMALYIFFYWRAKHRIARAAMTSIPPIKVLRDGKVLNLPPHLLVRGDVLYLKTGDTVPCDVYILEADSLKVYEANAFEGGGQVHKNSQPTDATEKAYAEMHNILFATSEILSGTCKAVCIATGRYTLAVRDHRVSSLYGDTTTDFFRKLKKRTSPLLYALTFFCMAILVCGFVYGNAQVFHNFFLVAACLSSLLFACSDGLAVIGHGISLDVLRRKKHARALLKNPLLADLLPQLDCIFVDTEMMFTSDALDVRSIHTATSLYQADAFDIMKNDGVNLLLSYASALDSCIVAETGESDSRTLISPEKSAMRRFFSRNSSFLSDEFKTISFRPSGSGFYFDSVLLSDDEGGLIVSSGDPLTVLRSSANFWNQGKVEPMSENLRTKLIDEFSQLRRQGRQLTAYAMTRSAQTQMTHSSLLHRNMTFLFYIAFERRESGSLEKFFNNCAKRKLEPIIFHNGTAESAELLIRDHPLLKKARICNGRALPDACENYAQLLDNYEVFASFSQEQKYKLFRELVDKKFKVGILAREGDDPRFLKDAHVVFLQSSSLDSFLKMSNEKLTPMPSQILIKESDLLVDHDINALSDSVEASFEYKRNLLSAFTYLTGMLILRVFVCLVGAFLGFSSVSMLGLLMLNFLWDTIVVYHLLIGSFKKDAKPWIFFPDFRHAPKRSVNFILPFVSMPICFAIAFPLLSYCIPKFSHGAMALSVFWTLIAATFLYARFGFGVRFLPLAKTRIIPILILVSLLSALPFVSTLFGVSFHWLSPVVTILATALFALFWAISNIRENKYKQ